MDRNGDNFLLNCQNAHTIGQSKRGIADRVVSLIAALLTSSADSVAIILDLIFIERLSPISFIFSNLMENKNIILL
ncbi:hypothetical protein NIES3787_25310 [Microcystis aeruginosa NIES-3787]|jgi:hypothetical protein|uniref:Uncharacterized protein n=1 Tax=Microcystis aeruginosa NIES-3787 TaxID=2517782 RepID=A0A6H9FUP8_MICAE|nr:hypothetical protein NIES3787_25310 [Microcystis aeruginosa NIES-3787]